jgi:hypothetical protein
MLSPYSPHDTSITEGNKQNVLFIFLSYTEWKMMHIFNQVIRKFVIGSFNNNK